MINNVVLASSVEEKWLGTTLNSELTFEINITGICHKASQKIHGLSRLRATYCWINGDLPWKRLYNLSLITVL